LLIANPFNEKFKNFIFCKLDGIYVPTVILSNGYNCSVNSSVAGNKPISLWYKNNDTINGEFQTSSALNIYFVG
jgi:hypothetical protein